MMIRAKSRNTAAGGCEPAGQEMIQPSREKPMKGAGTPLPGLRTTTVTGHGSAGSGLPAASPTA